MHVSVLGPDNQIQDSQKYHAAQGSLFAGEDRYDTGYKHGYAQGLNDTVRQKEPANSQNGFFQKLTYSQKTADRRDA
jgi:hypothetical protein